MFALLHDASRRLRKTSARAATRLTDIRVANIAAVDRPSNRRSWLLVKNADGSLAVRSPAATFDDALLGQRMRQVYGILGERFGALHEVLDGVNNSSSNKRAAIERALHDFVGSLEVAMPRMSAVLDGQEENRTIEKRALSRMRKARTVIGALIEGSEAMASKQSSIDWSKVDFEAVTRQILDNAVAALKKAQPVDRDSFQSGVTPKSAVQEFEDRVAVQIDKNPTLVRSVVEKQVFEADPELWARYVAETTYRKDGLTVARAKGGVATPPALAKSAQGSAAAEVERRRSEILAKSGNAPTMDQIFAEDRAAGGNLWERWERETSV